jgi:ABC-type multidrug transport system fused ATPase/permease subunit
MVEFTLMSAKKKTRLPKPKLTFDRLGQIFFTIREVAKLTSTINRKLLFLAFFFNAIWGFLAIPGFYLEKLIIDKLVESIGSPDLYPVLYSAGVLLTLALLLSLFRNILGSYTGFLRRVLSRYFDAELGVMIGQKLAELDMETLDDPVFQDRFSKVEKEYGRRAWGLMMPLSNIPNYLVGFISSVGIIVLLNPLIALGVILVSLPQIFIDSKYIKKGYEYWTRNSAKRRIWGWLSMYLVRNRNFMELKLLNLSNYLAKRIRKISQAIIDERYRLNKKREFSRFGSLIPLTVFEFGVSLLLVSWVIIGKITVGSFQLYVRTLRNAEQNLASLVSALLEIYENYIYVRDLVWFLNLKPSIASKRKDISVDEINSFSLEFKNVWFRYKKDQPWILKAIDFKIEPGERIAMVGPNGAGKTTLIKLITRFYDPQKGEISVGEKLLNMIQVDQWRDVFTVLFQQFESYPFSVKESIGFGDVRRINSLEGIKKAAKESGIDKYIEGLPLKYDNPLTPRFEKGVQPSKGQWQRIGIARVLFKKDSKFIVLDEPTSNVDPEAEEKIFQELVRKTEKRDKTLIFVTQRFSTVRLADRILVVDDGKIVEQGTHGDLMQKKGKYAKMFNIQAQAYLENNGKN